jgi:hypothetical protein
MHVVQPPGVWWVAADLGGTAERRSWLGPVVWLAFEVRLLAAERVAEGRSCRGRGAAGVLPLRFGRQTEYPTIRRVAGGTGFLGQCPAEALRRGEMESWSLAPFTPRSPYSNTWVEQTEALNVSTLHGSGVALPKA